LDSSRKLQQGRAGKEKLSAFSAANREKLISTNQSPNRRFFQAQNFSRFD